MSSRAQRCQGTSQRFQREDGEADEESQVEDAPEGEGYGFGEEKGEVLGPAFYHVGGGPVHAGGKGVGSVAEADGAAAAFDITGEGHVFEDFAADGAMASYSEVGFLLDEEELAVGGGEAATGSLTSWDG